MVSVFQDMVARVAQPGRVAWIGLRPARRAEVVSVAAVDVTTEGLVGDHSRPGKRAVSLIQAEHLAPIGAYLGRVPVAPEILRRNLMVEGLNLAALKGRQVAVGAVVLEIEGICAPCSRMEDALGPGGYSAVRGHGGWVARVIAPGRLAVGDTVEPLAP